MAAANALKEYIMQKSPDSTVQIADTLEYVSPLLNKAVTGGYVYLVRNQPKMYGSIYKNSDKNDTTVNKTMDITTSTLRNKLRPLIEDFRPDIIVTTHAFAAEILSALKAHVGLNIPIISIVTDFALHQAYIAEGVDAFIVSSREMVAEAVERGIDRVKLYPYGIPVKQEFYKPIDRKTAFESEGLDESIPTLLIMAGSFGVTDVLRIYHKIVKSPEDFQIIVITGKNEKLYNTFDSYLRKITINNTMVEFKQMMKASKPKPLKPVKPLKPGKPAKPVRSTASRNIKPSKPTKLLYYTNEVEKYMHMADFIITKPGGLTVSESIAANLPMVIFKAIPGQEEQNADFLVGKNMAVRLKKDATCTETITELVGNKQKLADMRNAIKTFSKGNSAANIYLLMKDLVEKYSQNN